MEKKERKNKIQQSVSAKGLVDTQLREHASLLSRTRKSRPRCEDSDAMLHTLGRSRILTKNRCRSAHWFCLRYYLLINLLLASLIPTLLLLTPSVQ